MRVLAVFVTALFAALYARRKPSQSNEITFQNGEPEPSIQTFEAAISEAWTVTKQNAENLFSGAAYVVQNVATDVEVAIVKTFGTKYDALIVESADRFGIDPDVLYRLLYEESRFRDDIITGKVRSSTGALGIAQFMPDTAREELGSVEAALVPYTAIPGAARYLAKLIASTGSVTAGVAAYNWGIGNVKRKGLAKAPPETVNYVKAITGDSIG